MKFEITAPNYSPETGLRIEWDPGCQIVVRIDKDEVLLRANKGGLRSLARLLLSLSPDEVPTGQHVHLDVYNSLEPESNGELIVEKIWSAQKC